MKDKEILSLKQQLEAANKLVEANAIAYRDADEKLKEV